MTEVQLKKCMELQHQLVRRARIYGASNEGQLWGSAALVIEALVDEVRGLKKRK